MTLAQAPGAQIAPVQAAGVQMTPALAHATPALAHATPALAHSAPFMHLLLASCGDDHAVRVFDVHVPVPSTSPLSAGAAHPPA